MKRYRSRAALGSILFTADLRIRPAVQRRSRPTSRTMYRTRRVSVQTIRASNGNHRRAHQHPHRRSRRGAPMFSRLQRQPQQRRFRQNLHRRITPFRLHQWQRICRASKAMSCVPAQRKISRRTYLYLHRRNKRAMRLSGKQKRQQRKCRNNRHFRICLTEYRFKSSRGNAQVI